MMKTAFTFRINRSFAGIFLISLVFSNFLLAQETLHVDWESSITNTNGASEKKLTQIEAANGVSFVGGFSSTETGQKMYVARYSATGSVDWELMLPSVSESSIIRLVIGNDGDLFVAGKEQALGSDSHVIHYARIKPDGNVIWHLTFDGNGGNDVKLTWMEVLNNHIYMIGTETAQNNYEIAWAAEFDLDGNMNWKTVFDPGTNAEFSDIQVNNKGDIAACGWAEYGYSYLLVAFDKDGNIQWQFPETLTDNSEMWFNDLTSDKNGNWIVVGSEETGSFSEFDAVTLKFDVDGNKIWEKHFNNTYENHGSLVEVSPDGSILTFANIEVNFDNSVRTISYDSDGNEQWATNYTIDDGTSVVNAVISGSGEIYLGVQDYDFSGVIKLSASGEVLEKRQYADSDYNYLADIAVDGNNVYACGYSSELSTIISLQSDKLDEVYMVSSTGIPTSDVQVGSIANNGANLWLGNTSYQVKNNVFSISKMDYSGNVLWVRDKQLAGSNPYFENLAVDASGNSIGFFESLVSGGVTDLGLVKYDPDGNEVFYAVYDSSATLHAGAVATDPDNNIYVGGYNQTSKLMFLSRLNPNGTEIWSVHYSSPSPSFPYAIPLKMLVSKQGKLVIAAIHKNADNVNNLYLFQYDSDGNIEWQTEVADQSGNVTSLCGFDVDEEGTVTVFGSSGTGQYVAAQYSSSGEQLWIDAGVSGPTVAPRSMARDNEGNTYLCFSSSTEAKFRKKDSSGNTIASAGHAIPSSGSYFLPFGCAFIEGKLAVIGEHNMNGNIFPLEMVLDDELNLISSRIDSLNQGDFRAMTVDQANNIHVAFTQGDIFAGPGFRTALVRQYSLVTTGINDIARLNNTIKLYPNPANEYICISSSVDLPKIESISLFDLSGRAIKILGQNVQMYQNQPLTLQLPSGLAPGTYILNMVSTDALYTSRFIKR